VSIRIVHRREGSSHKFGRDAIGQFLRRVNQRRSDGQRHISRSVGSSVRMPGKTASGGTKTDMLDGSNSELLRIGAALPH
jgi:hypothetical protein